MKKFVPRTLENGRKCCTVAHALCDQCKAHHARSLFTLEAHQMTNELPPDSFARDLKLLRAASAPPTALQAFEAEFQRARAAELRSEPTTIATLRAAHESYQETDLAAYEPPNGWKR